MVDHETKGDARLGHTLATTYAWFISMNVNMCHLQSTRACLFVKTHINGIDYIAYIYLI